MGVTYVPTDSDSYETLTRSELLAARAERIVASRALVRPAYGIQRFGSTTLSPDGQRLPSQPLIVWVQRELGMPFAPPGVPHDSFTQFLTSRVAGDYLGIDRTSFQQWRRTNRWIRRMVADRMANRVDVHPAEIWGDHWWELADLKEDPSEVAAINARTRARQSP